MIVIRPAEPSDAASLATLAERTFREAFAADNSAEDLDQHCDLKFGKEQQATACVEARRPAELHRIYVTREWHGRGVAQELRRAVRAAAARAGSDCISLGVWERNPQAVAFYRKCGFTAVGEHRFMLGNDPQRDLVLATQTDSLSAVT